MMTLKCKTCGKKYETTEDDLADWGKFCSEECWRPNEKDMAAMEAYDKAMRAQLSQAERTAANLKRRNEKLESVAEAAREMDNLLHMRLRYCPEAQEWLEEAYFKLKNTLNALEDKHE